MVVVFAPKRMVRLGAVWKNPSVSFGEITMRCVLFAASVVLAGLVGIWQGQRKSCVSLCSPCRKRGAGMRLQRLRQSNLYHRPKLHRRDLGPTAVYVGGVDQNWMAPGGVIGSGRICTGNALCPPCIDTTLLTTWVWRVIV